MSSAKEFLTETKLFNEVGFFYSLKNQGKPNFTCRLGENATGLVLDESRAYTMYHAPHAPWVSGEANLLVDETLVYHGT